MSYENLKNFNGKVPGWAIHVLGAGAPTVVQYDRAKVYDEAKRLLRDNGGGTAFIYRIEAMVHQPPAEFPTAVVTPAIPIMDSASSAQASAPQNSRVTIRVHGIYQRRDGVIVGPARWENNKDFSWICSGSMYRDDGSWSFTSDEHPVDIVREIVVGPQWQPWNGGSAPNIISHFCVVIRRDPTAAKHATANDAGWRHTGGPNDILAYTNDIPF